MQEHNNMERPVVAFIHHVNEIVCSNFNQTVVANYYQILQIERPIALGAAVKN